MFVGSTDDGRHFSNRVCCLGLAEIFFFFFFFFFPPHWEKLNYRAQVFFNLKKMGSEDNNALQVLRDYYRNASDLLKRLWF